MHVCDNPPTHVSLHNCAIIALMPVTLRDIIENVTSFMNLHKDKIQELKPGLRDYQKQ
jgi:ABC-type enterochelin transport system permease subunit